MSAIWASLFWGRRVGSRKKSRSILYAPAVEALERREMLFANLHGASLSYFSSGSLTPGSTIEVDYSIVNNGDAATSSGFTIQFYISPDGYIGNGNEYYVGTGYYSYSLLAGYSTYTQVLYVQLPDASSGFWSSSGYYTLGMIVDAYNSVFESNEYDNSNYGLYYDSDPLYVTVTTPDLYTSYFSVSSGSSFQPGDSVSVSAQITNYSSVASAGPALAYYLSRDATWDSQDVLLQSTGLPGFSAYGTYTDYETLTLPDSSNSVWDSSLSSYYLLTVVDPGNSIVEANEINNSGLGVGYDTVNITVNAGIDITNLPPTNFPPGALLPTFLSEEVAMLASVEKSYTTMARKIRGVMDITPLVSEIGRMRQSVIDLQNALQGIGYTGTVYLGSGPDAPIWNSASAELAERVLVSLFVSNNTLRASSDSVRENDPLKSAINAVKETFTQNGVKAYEKAAVIFGGIAIVGGVIGSTPIAVLGAAGAVVAAGVGMMLKAGINNIESMDKPSYQQQNTPTERGGRDLSYQNTNGFVDEISPGTSLGSSMKEVAQDATSVGSDWDNYWHDNIENQFDQIAQLVGGGGGHPHNPGGGPSGSSPISGKWTGDLYYPVTDEFGTRDAGGLMALTFSKNERNGQILARGSLNFTVFDGNTPVSTSRSKARVELQSLGNNQFQGQITARNPQGQSTSTTITLNMINGQLQGGLASQAQSSFTLRPV